MVKYKTTVTEIGSIALDFLKEKMVIFFKDGAPDELAEISLIHKPTDLIQEVETGDVFLINNKTYKITAVGEVANNNLRKMGHFTLKFDSKTRAELPGNIHVEAKELPDFLVGTQVIIKKGE
ncbi:MAG: glucitol/sorbitol system component [Thermosediminibacterales bacterium]|nr:glucitol/sorbitol system component [Thermosediminibacterales bacterium]MDK2835834.1 glucitol/sorbitol system component [Thermosediminibacterales bacterium]